jgi:hypothetical protein
VSGLTLQRPMRVIAARSNFLYQKLKTQRIDPRAYSRN